MNFQLFHFLKALFMGGFLLTAALLTAACSTQEPPVVSPQAAAIASAHPLATEAGMLILENGGNAFDAAVTVSAVLAVVEPYSSGIGGGGFWLLHRVADGRDVMIDGREKAPLAATRDMYLDEAGSVVPGLSVDGALAAAIPGEPAALVHIAEHYGNLTLAQLLAPAIRLAREGFPVGDDYRRMARFRQAALNDDAAAGSLFLLAGEVPPVGHVIRQPDLADTLNAIAIHGHAGFYAGDIAKRLIAGVQAAGGIWSMDDLAQYRVVERDPIIASYHGRRLVSAAPPSSGGIALATMLNILEGFSLDEMNAADRLHVIIESMRRAYRDRAEYLGDADFTPVPVERLTSKRHAEILRADISMERATPSSTLKGFAVRESGSDTTHFSILDKEGNRVAATLSINYPFGACVVPPGTGVLLNDEMDDFSAKPGEPNVYGLVGAEANAIEPGKRPLSSMSPTFIEDEQGVAILGTPGGSRIITMVLLAILESEQDRNPAAWVSLPRFHHQYLPDVVQFEPGAIDAKVIKELEAKGHVFKPLDSTYGNMHAIYRDREKQQVQAASDPRGLGKSMVENR